MFDIRNKIKDINKSNLEIKVNRLIGGRSLGIHKSLNKGTSTDFAEHKPYIRGDNIKYLDWRVYARTDRLYIKQYENYSNITAMIVVDGSASMDFGYKWNVSILLAAISSYLLIEQGDKVGLFITGNPEVYLEPKSGSIQRNQIMDSLENFKPDNNQMVCDNLDKLLYLMKKPVLFIIISDFLSENYSDLDLCLKKIRGLKNDLFVLHMVSEKEFDPIVTGHNIFYDPETGEQLVTDFKSIKKTYIKQFENHINSINRITKKYHFDFLLVVSEKGPEISFGKFLVSRKKNNIIF